MKVAFFDNLPEGGAKRVLVEEIKGLSVKHEVVHFSQARHCPPQVGFRPIDDLVKITYSYLFQRYVAYRINKLKCDVCIVHPDQNTQAPFLLRFLTVKSVYVCQEPLRLVYDPANKIPDDWPVVNKVYENLYRRALRAIDRRNLLSANVILANSHFSRRQIAKCYGVNPHVVYPGVDTSVFRPLGIAKEPFVLFVGGKNDIDGHDRLEKLRPYFLRKGISVKEIYFNVIPDLPRPSKPGEVGIGNPYKKNKNTGSRIKCGMTPRARNDSEMAILYNQAVCLLALDRREPFGLKVLEALACGTDVIAVSDGGYREIAKLYQNHGIKYFSWKKHCENILNYC